MVLLGIGIGGSTRTHPRGCRVLCAIAVIALAGNGCTKTSTTVAPAPPKCQVSLGTAPSAVDASGGSVTVPVATQSECAWNATTDVSWMTLTSSASGQGTGSVDVRISPNPDAKVRQGGLKVNDSRLEIAQTAAQCQFVLAPAAQTLAGAGGSATVAVTAAAGCAWSVTDAPSWITIVSGASGSGTGTVTFTVEANQTASPRTAPLTIAGQPYPVVQQPVGCTYTIDRNAETLPAVGGPGIPVAITATPGCAWTVTSSAPWIIGLTPGSGTGNGTVNFSVSVNSGGTPRTGTLMVAGQPLTVTQQSAACSYGLDHASQSFSPTGGAGTPIQVTATPGCAWTATSGAGWITGVTPGSGTGNGTVNFAVAANPSGNPRTGTLTIGDQTFTVTQQEQEQVACSFALDHASQTLSPAGGAGTPILVTAGSGCTWTVTSGAAWITLSSGSGTGSGAVNFSVGVNPNGTPRTGTLTVAGQAFTVIQQGAACSYSIDHASQSFPAAGGAGAPIQVTGTPGCGWAVTVTSGAAWITGVAPGSGTGNGSVNFAVAANPNGTPRAGTLTVGDQTFTVNQQAAACSYALDHASQSIGAAGGAGAPIQITATPGCPWIAASGAEWITGVAPGSGTGNGTVNFSVAANPNGTPRSGTMTVAGLMFTVNQPAAACSYSLDHASQSFPAAGGAGAPIQITATPGCAWTAASGAEWITGVAPGGGTGSGTVNFAVAANPSGTPRTGSLTIAGQAFTVTQQEVACSYSIDHASQSFPAAGGAGTPIQVTAPTGCGWTVTVTSGAAWITGVTGSGTGNGTVNFAVAANPSGTPRTGSLTVAGQPFTVTQQEAACSYSLAPTSQSFPAAGGTGTIQVTATPGCAWTATSGASWITGVTGSGTGNGTVNFAVAANPSGTPRTGSLTVAGQPFTVTQQEAACSYSLAPTSQSFPAAGGTGSIQVTATPGCAWTATSGASWITGVTPGSGTGNGTVNFAVAANLSGTARTGTLTVAGQTFTVTQQGAACSYSLDHTSQSFPAGGGTGSIQVTATPGCAWTATSGATWITGGPGSGTGNGTVNFSVAANPSGTARTGTLTVAGQTFTVTQQAAACSYSLDHTSQSFPAGGGTGSIQITAPAGCAWTATSGATWITGVTPGSGTGNGTVSFSVAANPSSTARTGTLTVGGQTFTVTQQGVACSYSLDHTSQSFPATGGTGTIQVTATPGCAWTAASGATWITGVTPGSGTGNGSVSFSVASNAGATRTGTLTIAGLTFTVSQPSK